ncbi:hypothetical protein J3R82DRAFT_5215 [Butyriboletus roseoflavus]|nr:hypothetical protein J3R82DRAFT_5215 [Butyriboletus roseoflavus]
MSLYTPVFPPLDEPNSLQKGLPENTSTAASRKQQSYVEFLRDVHLFLSTQNDVLSPPSRPNSPMFDHRVEKVRGEIQDVFKATGGDTSSGKWTRISQSLKLGCVRGRPWSVSKGDPCAPEEDTHWILPDEELEWIDWEKKREESRRLKGKTNTSPQIGNAAATIPDSQKPNHGSFVGLTQPNAMARQRPPRDVSPTTLRAAKEKVRKWQASVPAEVWHNTSSGSSPASTRAVAAERLQRSRTLDFAVVKPAVKSVISKRGIGPLSRPTVRSGSAPTPSHKPGTSKLLKPSNVPAPIDVGSKRPMKTSPTKDDIQTPFLPPSFPAHLATSTPLAHSVALVRKKPSLILPHPASSSMPLPSTPADLPEARQLIPAEPHATNVSPSLPPQISIVQPGKRSRGVSMSLDPIPEDPLLTLPAKRLRTLSQKCSSSAPGHSGLMSSNGELDIVSSTRDDARDPNLGLAPSRRSDTNSLEMVSGAPLTPGKFDQLVTAADAQGFPEKIPSPTKSVKSYFSVPDSDLADSPVKTNLLLESPVSPMLSYAQNPSGFLPQITSTQMGKESPTAGRTNNGIFGVGYSSQFDVERHVDRVSELLEKDVDFEGWLRDVRIVETSQDQ